MYKWTEETGPGIITIIENEDHAICRLLFGDGRDEDCEERETPLLKQAFRQLKEYWTAHRAIFTLPLAPGGTAFQRIVWETAMRIPYGEHFDEPTMMAALSLISTEENLKRMHAAVDDCPIPIFIPTHRVGDPEAEHDSFSYPGGEEVKGALLALEHPLS